ncbi:probable serine/threonine protein kinase IREH1 isoform X2 [Andrographis paniculata]|uniref:probable serine/threonine protein kinase IREH1 isoform X2 n=1 Tax=Andrographis paniculata TaxID=175694 RepID=UPI0021E79C34|nr:probable serine/threonine protein kinase IREH1 isoform X2 [Andrographis paniculata]
MVFKGRFFSSRKSDSSSPDGSHNSPRSLGSNSNSPIGFDKKKPKSLSPSVSKDASSAAASGSSSAKTLLRKKDSSRGKESLNSSKLSSGISTDASVNSRLKASEELAPSGSGGQTSVSVSPIVASSLGLNKIKTRSGPLPQESFFSFSGREKGVALGASTLSRPSAIAGKSGALSGKKKKDKVVAESSENRSNSDGMSSDNGALRDQNSHVFQVRTRLQNAESSTSEATGIFDPPILRNTDACTPETKTPYDCDNPKESESPRFQAILRLTSAPRKRFPGDIKSFSHELNSKGVRPYPFWKPGRLNNLEVLATIRAKFDKAKEEVDSDLRVFAADIVGILEKNAEAHPEWQETIEDLLVLARSCAMTSPGEFWLQCDGIVQELDDKRQELPMGMLKQLHTRMLFILTRCTRLLQFHKESGLAEDEHLFHLRQSFQPPNKQDPSLMEVNEKISSDSKNFIAPSTRKSYSQEQSKGRRDQSVSGISLSSVSETSKYLDSPDGRSRMASWKKFPSPSGKSPKEAASAKEGHDQAIIESPIKLDNQSGRSYTDVATTAALDIPAKDSNGPSQRPKHQHKVSWGYWGDQPSIYDESSIICRICEEEVPTLHVEGHSKICAIANRCDQKGLRVDERLVRIAETLEKLMESVSAKDLQRGVLDGAKVSNSSVTEESELSPKFSDWSRRDSEDMLDCFSEGDHNIVMDDLKALPSMSSKARLAHKSDQVTSTSSAGSGTPRSPLLTPRTSPIDLLLSGKGAFSENGDLPQISELADIARCVAHTPLDDDRSLEYLLSCLEDLKGVVDRRKFDSLTVDTFGARIEKLIREKYLQLCELVDDDKVDVTSTIIDEDAPMEDDVLRSLRNSPVHPSNDRTSIDDFEIIKPISRGAFGRVFLAKKRTTGDLFAIKVLKKADMIRKNAVESILAERDILISVRNPFVVRFFYSFTCRENLYLVMEYLNGGDLYSLLRNLGCLDEDVARVYIAEVVLALEYLHSLRVVHRDLKPDNLLIAHDGHIKLTDFGLSKVGLINSTDDLSGPAVSGTSLMEEDERPLSASEHQRERRKKRSAVGTPDYLAPEILLGTGHGFTADWWSVGVILFELIVGIPPFNAEHPQKIFENILNQKIPWPGVPDEMSLEAYDLIDRFLTEDPNQRLGAGGASEVKQHPFFKDINWDTLARQKAAFVPASEGAMDTSYFTSRYTWNPSNEHVYTASELDNSSEDGSMSGSSSCLSNRHEEVGDECGGLTEFDSSCDINYSFSNFSFKNLSQLASINYDLLTKGWKDDPPTNSGT